MPRPSHSRKDPAASDKFRQDLADKLQALDLPAGSRFLRRAILPALRRYWEDPSAVLSLIGRHWLATGSSKRFAQNSNVLLI